MEAMKDDSQKKWWEPTLPGGTPIPPNVRYECQPQLGGLKASDCKAAAFESFFGDGEVTLDPPKGPIIHVAGKFSYF